MFATGLVIAFTFVSQTAEQRGWKTYSPKDSGFTAAFAEKPEELREAGKISLQSVIGVCMYQAGMMRVPGVRDEDRKDLYDHITRLHLRDFGGDLISERDVVISGLPGRELRIKCPDPIEKLGGNAKPATAFVYVRFAVSGSQEYIFLVTYPGDSDLSKEAHAFLDACKIVEQNRAPEKQGAEDVAARSLRESLRVLLGLKCELSNTLTLDQLKGADPDAKDTTPIAYRTQPNVKHYTVKYEGKITVLEFQDSRLGGIEFLLKTDPTEEDIAATFAELRASLGPPRHMNYPKTGNVAVLATWSTWDKSRPEAGSQDCRVFVRQGAKHVFINGTFNIPENRPPEPPKPTRGPVRRRANRR